VPLLGDRYVQIFARRSWIHSDVDGFHSTGDGTKRDGVSQRESRN
jgi:hypothetical protein